MKESTSTKFLKQYRFQPEKIVLTNFFVSQSTENLRDKIHKLHFGAERSVLYHEMRQSFFDRIDRWIKLVTLVSGSGAVLALLKSGNVDSRFALYFSATVAILSLLNLTLRSGEMATKHAQLKQKFIALLISLEKINPVDGDAEKQVDALRIERLTIEKDEPPKHCYVDVKAHNELCRAKDFEDCWHLSMRQRFIAHLIRGTPSKLIKLQDYEKKGGTRLRRLFS